MPSYTNKHTTIFIIDDDEDDIHFFIDAVKEVDKSVECIGSNNPLDALNLLKKQDSYRPDYIFLDLNMPRMNGKKCLSELKKIDTLYPIPVFILSTSNTEDVKELKQLGAAHYFVKPCRFKDMLHMIEDVLANKWQ